MSQKICLSFLRVFFNQKTTLTSFLSLYSFPAFTLREPLFVCLFVYLSARVRVCVVCALDCRCPRRSEEGTGSQAGVVMRGYEPPIVSARHQIQVLCKSSVCFYQLRSLWTESVLYIGTKSTYCYFPAQYCPVLHNSIV